MSPAQLEPLPFRPAAVASAAIYYTSAKAGSWCNPVLSLWQVQPSSAVCLATRSPFAQASSDPGSSEVTLESRRAVKEFSIKGCTECCFSTGGHMVAAANLNSITIYNVYTFEAVASLRCRPATRPAWPQVHVPGAAASQPHSLPLPARAKLCLQEVSCGQASGMLCAVCTLHAA